MNWQELAFNSHYQTAEAIKQQLIRGDIEEATAGVKELIEAMGRSEKRSLQSQLVRLMTHVIKWKIQPERRTKSWILSIRHARREIEETQEEYPSLNRNYIQTIWEKCLNYALKDAETETEINPAELSSLSWQEVFEHEYHLH